LGRPPIALRWGAGGKGAFSPCALSGADRAGVALAHMGRVRLLKDTFGHPPALRTHGTPTATQRCTKPIRSSGIGTDRIAGPTSAWMAEWLPMLQPAAIMALLGLPGALVRHWLIGHPCAFAGWPGSSPCCWGSGPRLRTAARSTPRPRAPARLSSRCRSAFRFLGCSEQS